MNSVHLIGTVKFAPKLNTFNSGSCKASTIIETPPADGQQYSDKADVVAWDDQAMALADLKPGDAVEIHGRVKTESWDDRASGQKRYKMVVLASSVASPSRTVRAASASAKAAGRFGNAGHDAMPMAGLADSEEIPF
jgi:single-stranded DNA-binding protein